MSHNNNGKPVTRREALRMIGGGFGMMAFAGMVKQSLALSQTPSRIAKLDFPQRVKRVVFLFMNGGMSQVDTFDPKPMPDKYDGQPLPGGTIKTERKTGELMKSPFTFKKYGECGMDISELWPYLADCADDIAWIRSVYTDIPNHARHHEELQHEPEQIHGTEVRCVERCDECTRLNAGRNRTRDDAPEQILAV